MSLRNLITDVAGVLIGNAHDERLASGVTAILFEEPAVASVDVRGGAPGPRETGLLAPHRTEPCAACLRSSAVRPAKRRRQELGAFSALSGARLCRRVCLRRDLRARNLRCRGRRYHGQSKGWPRLCVGRDSDGATV